jgi:transposase
MKLKMMAVKYGSKITEVSAYLTSKNCHNCLQTNDNLEKSKLLFGSILLSILFH